jgi:putative alpha-1,2-mannosidase
LRNRPLYEKYIRQANRWRNLWNEGALEPRTGLRGFFAGRNRNGSWVTGDVAAAGRDGEFYEESAWSYSWFVPHDYAGLIALVGGEEKFVERLGMILEKVG